MATGYQGFAAVSKKTEAFTYKRGYVGFAAVSVKRQIFTIPSGFLGFAGVTELSIPARIFRKR